MLQNRANCARPSAKNLLFFRYGRGEGINAGIDDVEWVIAKDRFKYDEAFDKLGPIDGKVSGAGEHNSLKLIFRD